MTLAEMHRWSATLPDKLPTRLALSSQRKSLRRRMEAAGWSQNPWDTRGEFGAALDTSGFLLHVHNTTWLPSALYRRLMALLTRTKRPHLIALARQGAEAMDEEIALVRLAGGGV